LDILIEKVVNLGGIQRGLSTDEGTVASSYLGELAGPGRGKEVTNTDCGLAE